MKNLKNLFASLFSKKEEAADNTTIENTETKRFPTNEVKDDKTEAPIMQVSDLKDMNYSPLKANDRVLTNVIRETKARLDAINGDDYCNQDACASLVSEVFVSFMMEHEVTEKQLPYLWSRFLRMAMPYMSGIPDTFLTYINESNYILMTSAFQKMTKGAIKNTEGCERRNLYGFMETFYKFLLEKFPDDRPSLLALGKAYEGKKEYGAARQCYLDFMDLEDIPYNNGLSALLASYENEVKDILKDREGDRMENRQKIRKLNGFLKATYEYWQKEIREAAESGGDDRRREFVSFVTHYARFETYQSRFEHAYELLSAVPDDYPDLFRVYGELGLLYQMKGKTKENVYYDLDKAIESFCRAEEIFLSIGTQQRDAKVSEKCILMPLANIYYQAGRKAEALEVCNKVLLLDSREWRAKELKRKIEEQVA